MSDNTKDVSVNVYANGTEIPITKLSSINISYKKNEPLTWTLTTALDQDKEFCTENSLSPYYSVIQPEPNTDSFRIEKTWSIKLTVGSQTFWFKNLPLIVAARELTSEGYVTVFSGTDGGKQLYTENQEMDAFTSSESHTYYAKEVIIAILRNFGITEYSLNFEDFPIRQVLFSGESPISVIKRILAVRKAFYRMDGMKFIVESPNSSAGAKFTYTDYTGMFRFNSKKTYEALFNEITVTRGESSADRYIFEEAGDAACGEKSVTFPELFHCQWHLRENYYGSFQGHRFVTPSGTEHYGTGYAGICNKFTFVFKQDIIANAAPGKEDLARWKFEITGIPASEWGLIANFDDKYSVTIKDDKLIKAFGSMPAPSQVSEPMIPNQEVAEQYAKLCIEEQARTIFPMQMDVVLNPWIFPGNIVHCKADGSNIDHNYFIDSNDMNISISSEGSIDYDSSLSGGRVYRYNTYVKV